jgi:hypothetical protein
VTDKPVNEDMLDRWRDARDQARSHGLHYIADSLMQAIRVAEDLLPPSPEVAELAKEIQEVSTLIAAPTPRQLAKILHASGYRKDPTRAVYARDELDLLPEGTILRDCHGRAWTRLPEAQSFEGHVWGRENFALKAVAVPLPAVVLYTPPAEPVATCTACGAPLEGEAKTICRECYRGGAYGG